MMLARTTPAILGLALLTSACATGERITHHTPAPGGAVAVRAPAPTSAREEYARQLAAVDPSAFRTWEEESRRALRSGLSIAPSFQERVSFPVGSGHAVAYRFALREGQTLLIRLEPVDRGVLYADVFHDVGGLFRPAHSAAPGTQEIRFTATTTGEYVVRLQPQIDGGTFDVVVAGNASLVFPVAGAGLRQLGSAFGDPRDGGRRRHEGIDIMAPRGTPVLAVTSGRVVQARNTPVGGLVIWLADDASDLSYYYAHLDELLVREGTYVTVGDTIGTVGNTGNARTAPPHLHFGAYRPGTIALDPAPLLVHTAPLRPLAVDHDLLGRWARTSEERVRLRASPDLGASIVAELEPETSVLVLGGVAEWHRVLLPDGTTGFLSTRLTQSGAQQ